MSGTDVWPEDHVAGGAFLQSLDLQAAAEPVVAVPGMLTRAEHALLTQIVRRAWRGDGVIVDGGSFLGSSLVAEAHGMEMSPLFADLELSRFPSGKPIHGYELGYHPAPANPAAERRRSYGSIEYVLGESFVPMLEENIAPYRGLVQLHIGDVTEMDWDGYPVELAFIDVCKTHEINAHVSRQFYPALIPGGSRLIHQDFFFDRLPWIRVTMGYLADYFRWEGQVASSSVYTNVKTVPKNVADYDPFTEATLEECLAYHDAVEFPGIDRTAELKLALSRVHLILHKGSRDRALEQLLETAVEYRDLLGVPSTDDSYKPTPGTPDATRPRFRMDRTIAEVLGGTGGGGRGGVDRKAPTEAEPPTDFDRARAALSRRDWEGARQILEPLTVADPDGTAAFLLARTEFESGHPDIAAAMLDSFLTRRPRHARALALRARVHLDAGERAAARAKADEALRRAPGLLMAQRVLFEVAVADQLDASAGSPPSDPVAPTAEPNAER